MGVPVQSRNGFGATGRGERHGDGRRVPPASEGDLPRGEFCTLKNGVFVTVQVMIIRFPFTASRVSLSPNKPNGLSSVFSNERIVPKHGQ